ncbi:hypothetical protein KAT82_05010 [bacterium]|nr:hypothetical protein [bacterium]
MKQPRRTRRWVAPLVGALMIACAVLGAVPAARAQLADEPPLVVTSFRIETDVFDKFDQPTVERLADGVATHLFRLCDARFGFLTWGKLDSSTLACGPARELTVRLVDGGGQGMLRSIYLEYSGGDPGDEGSHGRVERKLLYRPTQDKPTQNWRQLLEEIQEGRRDLAEKLEVEGMTQHFADQDFCDNLHNTFLRGIPIARDVIPNSEIRALILPVRYRLLRATRESILRVQFRTSSAETGGVSVACEIDLHPVGWVNLEDCEGAVQCVIEEFVCLGIDKEEWDVISEVLSPARCENLRVLMHEYEPSYEGTMSDPGLGGGQ